MNKVYDFTFRGPLGPDNKYQGMWQLPTDKTWRPVQDVHGNDLWVDSPVQACYDAARCLVSYINVHNLHNEIMKDDEDL